MTDEFDYQDLDPGIRETVKWLRSLNFNTTDSGDGVSKPAEHRAMDFPHVVIRIKNPNQLIDTADELFSRLRWAGVDVIAEGIGIEATYFPSSGVSIILLINLDDSCLVRSRKND